MKLYHGKEENGKKEFSIATDFSELQELASQGLLSLSVKLGMKALKLMMEEEVTSHAGTKGKHNTSREAYRHGYEKSNVTLGGQKVKVDKPRVRSKEYNAEIPLETLIQFQEEDVLNDAALKRILHGVSMRKYEHTLDDIPIETNSVSKSSVSRRFVKATEKLLEEFLTRKIENHFPVIMIDGVYLGDYIVMIALGISTDGEKKVLGIKEGTTENAGLCKELLNDIIDRGLDLEEKRLFVIDGGKGIYKAIKQIFGKDAQIQRCQIHKKRNVQSYLPKSEQKRVGMQMNKAYQEFDYEAAKKKLELIAKELNFKYPSASSSIQEGLEETLTLHKLGIPGLLRISLSNTNPIESAIGTATNISKRVKKWSSGNQVLRWAASGLLLAENKFRKIKGYKQIPLLINILSDKKADSLSGTG